MDQQQAGGQQDWNGRIDTGQTIRGEMGQEKQFVWQIRAE